MVERQFAVAVTVRVVPVCLVETVAVSVAVTSFWVDVVVTVDSLPVSNEDASKNVLSEFSWLKSKAPVGRGSFGFRLNEYVYMFLRGAERPTLNGTWCLK